MSSSRYINYIIGKIFKILPLKEERNAFYVEYLDSLFIELSGAEKIIEGLNESLEFTTVLSTIKYLRDNEYDNAICKREVFKMISCIKKINLKAGV